MHRRKADLDELVASARARGMRPDDLKQVIHNMVVGGMSTDNWRYQELWRQAAEISAGGLRSQLTYLYDVCGLKRAEAFVAKGSNALDAFVKGVSSELEDPIDEEDQDLDEDGDPWE